MSTCTVTVDSLWGLRLVSRSYGPEHYSYNYDEPAATCTRATCWFLCSAENLMLAYRPMVDQDCSKPPSRTTIETILSVFLISKCRSLLCFSLANQYAWTLSFTPLSQHPPHGLSTICRKKALVSVVIAGQL